jgi:type IV secretory pathway TrbD component
MANLEPSKRRRGLVAIDGAMALIVILLVVQIWLLSATLETFLVGHSEAVVPAAVFSALIFSGCLALNLFVTRVDQQSRKP